MTTIQQWSGVRLANVGVIGQQQDGDVTTLANGNLVVTWENMSTGQVYFRMFDPAGNALTDEILVDGANMLDTRYDPSIAAFGDGGFAITVESTNGSGGFHLDTIVYDVNGTIVAEESQSATLDSGTRSESFTVGDDVWMVNDRTGEVGLFRHDSSGFTGFSIIDPGSSEGVDGVQLRNGNVAIAWENSTENQIEFQILDTNAASVLPGGTAISFTYNGSTPGHEPTLAALGNGGFVIVHRTFGASFPGQDADIIAHIIEPDGTVHATNIFVDSGGTAGNQESYAVVGLANGGFMVVWGDNDSESLFARTFDGVGNATSDRMVVATGYDDLYLRDIEATLMEDGRVAVTWSTVNGGIDTDGNGAYFSILDPRDGQVIGDGGANLLYGSNGNDNVHAQEGNDTVHAMAGNDYVEAGDGNDTVNGGDGDDVLLGEAGTDTLNGGDDNDILIGGADADVLNGGDGIDTASYLTSNGGVVVNLAFNVATTSDAAGDTFSSIENVWGSNFNDVIRGTSGANELHGAGGNDQLLGDAGNDMLFGGRGNDILRGGAGADALVGGAGFDVADYSDSAARVLVNLFYGNALEGDAQGDTLASIESVFGSAFNDIIRGSTGNNALRGNAGNDILTGDGGADLFQYADTNWGSDLITDFTDGVDLLDLRGSGLAFGDLTITASGGDTYVSITATPGSAIKLDNFVATLDASDFLF